MEIELLINFFKTNAYPDKMVSKLIYRFMNSKCSVKNKTVKLEAKKLMVYHKLPYLNDLSCSYIKKEIDRIIDKFYPHIDLRLVFFNPFSIKGLLNHKEKLPAALCSGIIYDFTCSACSATYIGSSMKCLKSRANEHFGRSSRTGNLLVRPLQSKVREHIFNCNSTFNLEDFKVLSSFGENTVLRIAESLEIAIKKPSINSDTSSFPLHLI